MHAHIAHIHTRSILSHCLCSSSHPDVSRTSIQQSYLLARWRRWRRRRLPREHSTTEKEKTRLRSQSTIHIHCHGWNTSTISTPEKRRGKAHQALSFRLDDVQPGHYCKCHICLLHQSSAWYHLCKRSICLYGSELGHHRDCIQHRYVNDAGLDNPPSIYIRTHSRNQVSAMSSFHSFPFSP